MFPLYDETRRKSDMPKITIALIIINVICYLLFNLSSGFHYTINGLGMVPSKILSGKQLYGLFTSLFLHANIFHLIGNMWFLWLFGGHLEDGIKPLHFIMLYFLAGVVGDFAHILTTSQGSMGIPAIGASGSVSGLIAGYVYLYPKNKLRMMIWLLFRVYFFSVSSLFFVVIWFIGQIIFSFGSGNVAYSAHIGAFLCGLGYIYLLKRKSGEIENIEKKDRPLSSKKLKTDKKEKKIKFKTKGATIKINGQ